MAQQPAVVIVARHGPRLDGADSTWHLSTPTPYDPPLTYGGWNQSRSLGVRIASLLHAREQELNTAGDDGATTPDATQLNGNGKRKERDMGEAPSKRRRVKHKVVIHSSPFLRCLQTSIAIAAGMAEYKPRGSREETAPKRVHSVAPRLRTEGPSSPGLAAVAESKTDLARKALSERKRYRKSKLRVDAFLGEWLNPSYFEGITSPPPSAMMVTTAKAELLENEVVEIFTPAAPRAPPPTSNAASASLWSGSSGTNSGPRPASPVSPESPLEDFSSVQDSLLQVPQSPTSRRSSASHVGEAESGRKSPFRPGSTFHPLASTVPKQETSIYHPPTPHYAVSSSHQIPRGYVVHARNACADVDYAWDSSRPPLEWGDGGVLGEEWSSLHKRFRRGLNHLIYWYSQHDADFQSEDSVVFDPTERNSDAVEEQEDLVVIMVTHGAGCNALIGALTGQPVLLDVGMASLTMAVRREDAPSLTTYASSQAPSAAGSPGPESGAKRGPPRRSSLDVGLSSVYEMKVVSSSEHLRPGADSRRGASPSGRTPNLSDPLTRQKQRLGIPDLTRDPPRSNTNSTLGSIRRPSTLNVNEGPRSSSLPRGDGVASPTLPLTTGLWTPPQSRTPNMRPNSSQGPIERPELLSTLSDAGPITVAKGAPPTSSPTMNGELQKIDDERSMNATTTDNIESVEANTGDGSPFIIPASPDDEKAGSGDSSEVDDLLKPGDDVPSSLKRGLSQKGLWGTQPSGQKVERKSRNPKRRWTVNQD